MQGNDGIAIRFSFFFLLVAETLKREQEKAWEQKWPEGEMTKMALEMQGMVVQECCFAVSLCETPFCLMEGGERDHSPVKSDFLVLFRMKCSSSGPSPCGLRILTRECQGCGTATAIANLKVVCGLSCHF